MRIIAGELRGRKLLPPGGMDTRPITDRAKQSLFDILSPQIPEARVYDLFAGTGSMGIECLSRGADHVTFFEANRSAVASLRRNIEALDVQNRSTVMTQDLFRWFAGAREGEASAEPIDLVFLDPPYRFLRAQPHSLQTLATRLRGHLAADAIVVFRHDSHDALQLPGLHRYDQREYGGMMIEFLRPHD